jgi:hypothetical protein
LKPRQPLLIAFAFLAVAAGVCVRIDGAARISFWVDEVSTVSRIAEPTIASVIRPLKDSPFPPLHYVLLWLWTKPCGSSDLVLRAFPTFLGVLALPATYFGWRGLIGHRAALWSVVLLALNGYHIWYSRDIKMYAGVWLLATVSSCSFLRVLLRPSLRVSQLVLYGIATGCLPLLSYVGIVPLIVQIVFSLCLLVTGRVGLRRLCVVAGALAGPLIPSMLWLPSAVRAATWQTGITWIPPARLVDAPQEVIQLVGAFLFGYRTFDSPAEKELWMLLLGPPYCLAVLLTVAMMAYFTIRVTIGSRNHDLEQSVVQDGRAVEIQPHVILYLATWFVLPVVGILDYSYCLYSLWGVPRYLAGAAPGLIIWLGTTLGTLPSRAVSWALGVLVLSLNLAVLTFDATHYSRTPWREISRAIRSTVNSDSPTALPQSIDSVSKGRLVIVWGYGPPHDKKCLAHALASDSRATVEFATLAQAIKQRVPFLLISHKTIGRAANADSPLVMQSISCRPIFSALVFEEVLTGLPSPLIFYQTRVWHCDPLLQENPTAMPLTRIDPHMLR